MTDTEVKKVYFNNIDLLKGILILLVIAGHIIRGTLETSLARYIIYSFHMPLFIGISGFLINEEWLKREPIYKIILKYTGRIIIPWIASVFIYTYVVEGVLNIDNILIGISKPYYHLWFVLGYMLYIILYMIILRIGAEKWGIVIALIISVVFYSIDILPIKNEGLLILIKYIWKYFKPQFFIFFLLGSCVRSGKIKRTFNRTWWIFGIMMYFAVRSFYIKNPLREFLVFFIFNSMLTIILAQASQKGELIRVRSLEWIGKNSYSFYLWHVLGKIAAERIVGVDNLELYYKVNVVFFIMYTVAILCWSNLKVGVKKYRGI